MQRPDETPTEPGTQSLTLALTCDATLSGLRAVLDDVRLRWAYAEREADTGLGTCYDLREGRPLGAPHDGNRPGVPLQQWQHGRAFGPGLEVAWWREVTGYRLRAVTEGPLPAGVAWESASAALHPVGQPYLVQLHGSLDAESDPDRPTWSEARIPRHLTYPVTGAGDGPPVRVALQVQALAQEGRVVLIRLLEVIGLEED